MTALTCTLAQQALDAALDQAESLGVAVTICVVDPGGHAKALMRMDRAPNHSVTLALDKAGTAAGFGMSTDKWAKRLEGRPHLMHGLTGRQGFIPVGGGVPIVWRDEILGAFGVSGGLEGQDGVIAQAGVDAVLAALSA
jgi:uncharacterized protein GlcG (DUF336 family)